ncbi:MAG: Crp/Fnr family transcriptional regulator [Eubacteriales bacterium]|nr:Crp/Fnr family transcriptional regulator [Eubacteriales bacterium]MDD3199755.1 Crp/Fnr family transcriptional regulator [Eubacteriales bacterium]MDD4121931.1 Crp/Fnr family transcriptional regulator [Eubacteriales bacterium]MDD4629995.1 Crp/Fnr family transcriptional regulator [Eubacteriales bacterium]
MVKNNSFKILKGCSLFDGLTSVELSEVYRYISPSIKGFEKKDTVIEQGGRVAEIGYIKKGTLISTEYYTDGEAHVLRTFSQGDLIGLDTVFSKQKESLMTISCQTRCVIIFLSFHKMFEENTLRCNIKEKIFLNAASILSDEHTIFMNKINVLLNHTLQDRILTYLNMISEKRSENTIDIHMTQKQFAQFLGVNRSVLSNELNWMRNEGIIDYNKSLYTILQK